MRTDDYLRYISGEQKLDDDLVQRMKIKLMAHILHSHLFFQRNYSYCVTKRSELVLADPWYGQAYLDYTIESQRRLGFGQRVVEIKPRQVGWTQSLLSRCVWTCLHPHHNAVVFVPDKDVAQKTMVRVGTILNGLPAWLSPMRQVDNRDLIIFQNPNPKERDFDPGLNSSLACVVPADYRGATGLSIVILSEFAKYQKSINVAAFMTALQGGIGEHEDTCIVVDTTPQGHDNYYEPMAEEAIERNPQWVKKWYKKGRRTRAELEAGAMGVPDAPDDWVPVFSRWIDHTEYSCQDDTPDAELPPLTEDQIKLLLKGPKGEFRIGTVDKYGNDEETMLMEVHGATLGNIMWRRNKINKIVAPDYNYKRLAFQQEFALTASSAFISYGVTPFDPLCLNAVRNMVRDPYAEGMLKRDENGLVYMDPGANRSQWESMRMWTAPQGTEAFIMGVDLAHAYENVEADDTFVQVLRRHDQKQVFVYQAKVPPYILRQRLQLIYEFYNNALLVVETEDGIGYSLVRELYDAGCTNQYYWKRIDADVPKVTDYLGWETNPRTRPIMQEVLVEEINKKSPDGKPDPGVIIRDIVTVQQLESLERSPEGYIEGSGKTHDDAAICLMFTLTVNRDAWHGYALPSKEEERRELNSLVAEYGNLFSDTGQRQFDLENM